MRKSKTLNHGNIIFVYNNINCGSIWMKQVDFQKVRLDGSLISMRFSLGKAKASVFISLQVFEELLYA